MSKQEEIKLRFEFEANCRNSGLCTALTVLGNYRDATVQTMWVEVKSRGYPWKRR